MSLLLIVGLVVGGYAIRHHAGPVHKKLLGKAKKKIKKIKKKVRK